jgi:protein ImuB
MFAVLLLPNFRLQAALRFREELRERPVAISDENEAKTGLLEVSEAAAGMGVRPGLSSPQAQARCPQLTLLMRSRPQERAAQAALLEIATAFSPAIEATADGYCTVSLQASRDKDWAALAGRMVEALGALRLSAQAGIGPNPDLAFLAARNARPVLVAATPGPFLANLAIHELDPPPELLSVLRDWGIHQLGQLTSLPRGELMDRLGPEAARLWERAAGRTERPLRLVRPAEEFVEAYDFEHEIDTVEPVLFLLRRFLDQLALRLENVGRVAGRMTLTLALANGGAHERSFTVPSPTAFVDVLFRILHTHLEGLRLEHCATGLQLRIEPEQAERQQFQLFESPLRDPNRFGETLGRLAALVGAEHVGAVEVIDAPKPGVLRLQLPRFHEITRDAPLADDLAVGLPLRRYRPAVPARVHVVQHQIKSIVSEKARGVIRESLGPFRASGGWWESDRWATEEWDIALENGGLYRLARAGNEWRVEGSYSEAVVAGGQPGDTPAWEAEVEAPASMQLPLRDDCARSALCIPSLLRSQAELGNERAYERGPVASDQSDLSDLSDPSRRFFALPPPDDVPD